MSDRKYCLKMWILKLKKQLHFLTSPVCLWHFHAFCFQILLQVFGHIFLLMLDRMLFFYHFQLGRCETLFELESRKKNDVLFQFIPNQGCHLNTEIHMDILWYFPFNVQQFLWCAKHALACWAFLLGRAPLFLRSP